MARYHYCAVPTDDASMLDMMAKACLRLKWREGVCSGIPAKAFDAERMLPSLRENSAYCSHGMRILPLLCATAVRRREIDWVREAFDMVKKVAALSYQGADGMIYTPLQFDADGQPGVFGMASRPSDTGIIIGGLVYAADAFLRLGDEASAQECADYGWRYAKTLIRMQCENGEFYERYRYPSLEPSCGNRGTVNNWCMHVWNLQTILKRFGRQEEADALRNLASRYVDSQLTKSPSILKVCGGGEDVADFGDALNTASTLFTIKYILTGDEAYRKYTEQAMKKSWLMSCMYADMPEFFGIHGNSDLGIYYDQPNGIFSAGGMHDLTAIEAGLFAYHNLGIAFGRDLADVQFCEGQRGDGYGYTEMSQFLFQGRESLGGFNVWRRGRLCL